MQSAGVQAGRIVATYVPPLQLPCETRTFSQKNKRFIIIESSTSNYTNSQLAKRSPQIIIVKRRNIGKEKENNDEENSRTDESE
jgi:hypothetical protein